MNFLILEGYKEGALKFEKESGIKAEIDHAQIDARIMIRKLILDGKIEEALREINELNSEVSPETCVANPACCSDPRLKL